MSCTAPSYPESAPAVNSMSSNSSIALISLSILCSLRLAHSALSRRHHQIPTT
jgi:hypothetical protein